jgi:DNA-binding SARP family transcriptional activator
MAPAFFLTTLGLPELRGPDGKVVRFRVRKHLALLVYLAVERRRAHDRSRLVELFWPHLPGAQGRHSFSTALSLIRSVFGRTAFPASRPAVRFAPSNLVVDLERLEVGAIFGEHGAPDLEVDGFLRGFELEDAPEFGWWKEREHARRLPAIHAGLLTLIDHGRRRGSHDEIMRRADRLLAIDHLAEEGIRARMEAFALVGDRFSAIRVFDEWKDELKRELGAEPSMVLEGMAAQLRKRGWEPKEPNPRPAVPAEQWRDRRFVGRAEEYRRLYEAWETVHQYRPRHVLISGDSGIGKTTLAQRLVTAAGLEGASVARVQCFQLEQRIPFAAIGGLVAGLLGRPGVAATAPEALAEIARIVPQVRSHFPTLPTPKQSEGESARLLFAEAVIDFLKAVMEERSLLLVMDDYHHADEASLAVWHMVTRRIQTGRFMSAVTAPSTHVANAFYARADHLAVGPMAPDEAAQHLDLIFGTNVQTPQPFVRRTLLKASSGFPMALELVVQDWIASGDQSIAMAFSGMTPRGGNKPPPSHDQYGALIQRVISELQPSTRLVLQLAAILGERLNELSLYTIVEISVSHAMEALVELVDRRILREFGSGLEFINELVRIHAYWSIPSTVRPYLHNAIARAIQVGATSKSSALELAWHLTRAGQIDEAQDELLIGARQAVDSGAPDSAVLALRSAVPHIANSEKGENARLLLAEALQEISCWRDSLDVLNENSSFRAKRAQIATVLRTQAELLCGELTRAQQIDRVFSLLGLIASKPERDTIAKAALLLGRLITNAYDPGASEAVLTALDAIDRTGYSAVDEAHILAGLAMAQFHFRDRRRPEGLITQALELLEKAGVTSSIEVHLRIGASVIQVGRGKYDEALKISRCAFGQAERLDNVGLQASAANNVSMCLCRLGRFEEQVDWSKRTAPIFERLAVDEGRLLHRRNWEVTTLSLLGRYSDATTVIRAADVTFAEADMWLRQAWHLIKADVFWLGGSRGKALACARFATEEPFDKVLSIAFAGKFARWLAIRSTQSDVRGAEDRILDLLGHSETLDAFDYAEVLGGLLSLRTSNQNRSGPTHNAYLAALNQLPGSAVAQLVQLGVPTRF